MVWQIIEVSAPGKIILHGEHAVVYGKAAVAMSLGLRSHVILESCPTEKYLALYFKDLSMQLKWDIEDIKEVFANLDDSDNLMHPSSVILDKIKQLLHRNSVGGDNLKTKFGNLSATIFLFLYLSINKAYKNSAIIPVVASVKTELSLGAGMGSSASYAVCLSAAFLAASGAITDHLSDKDIKLISDWAFGAETIAHGHPSGIDNSICSYGGALLFKDHEICSTLANMPLLKVLLVDTGIERNTSQLVSNVKQKINLYPDIISCIMNTIDAISLESWRLLSDSASGGKLSEKMNILQDLVKMNQCFLKALNVSHPKLDEICDIAQKHNFVAKLTGAGGGGCAFILLPTENEGLQNTIDDMKSVLASQGFQYWDVSLGGSGVTVKII